MVLHRYSARADADLLDIWLFIAADNPQAADRLLLDIDEQCRLLAENNRLGMARPEIAPEARSWPLGRYLILYRVIPDGIEVVRVIHGARDLRHLED
ncbi:type II toxin-antitoxin system RelE/ParE family toxin (plasmid) [Skermanella mucosa]|uniref:type II toxin-antitoxin system RelE/ParE family toxin n=1 Tax=Skermanella mucosa TaxID=1789672 RepID=UPI00192B15E7|nr:type II toxin-antitoxin system RelE/ParE family toxin [Skermanella mucosa]UEM25435.1 type II toxin-antitoxin system RelE/ParE family toxin [Skermanella mucosa]